MGNRQETEAKLLKAVARIIQRDGLAGIGINAIAREAEVNKTLIYRYFDSLEGLLKVFGESQDFWPDIDEILGDNPADLMSGEPARVMSTVLRNHCEALLRRPLTIEILARECVERDTLTIILEEIRERRSHELFEYLNQNLAMGKAKPESLNLIFGCGALLTGALQYFLIRARFIKIYGGLDIQSESGRQQIYALIDQLAAGLTTNLS